MLAEAVLVGNRGRLCGEVLRALEVAALVDNRRKSARCVHRGEVVAVLAGDASGLRECCERVVGVAPPVQGQAEHRASDGAPRRCRPAALEIERLSSRIDRGADVPAHVAVDGAQAGDARFEWRQLAGVRPLGGQPLGEHRAIGRPHPAGPC